MAMATYPFHGKFVDFHHLDLLPSNFKFRRQVESRVGNEGHNDPWILLPKFAQCLKSLADWLNRFRYQPWTPRNLAIPVFHTATFWTTLPIG